MIAERLKMYRGASHLSQVELGKITGIHPVTISEWERGNTKGIKAASVIKLAEALNVTPNDLLGVEDDGHPDGAAEKENAQ